MEFNDRRPVTDVWAAGKRIDTPHGPGYELHGLHGGGMLPPGHHLAKDGRDWVAYTPDGVETGRHSRRAGAAMAHAEHLRSHS